MTSIIIMIVIIIQCLITIRLLISWGRGWTLTLFNPLSGGTRRATSGKSSFYAGPSAGSEFRLPDFACPFRGHWVCFADTDITVWGLVLVCVIRFLVCVVVWLVTIVYVIRVWGLALVCARCVLSLFVCTSGCCYCLLCVSVGSGSSARRSTLGAGAKPANLGPHILLTQYLTTIAFTTICYSIIYYTATISGTAWAAAEVRASWRPSGCETRDSEGAATLEYAQSPY